MATAVATYVSKVFPASDLRLHTAEVLEDAERAPVIITHRSRPKVVVCAYDAFVSHMERLAQLEEQLAQMTAVLD